MVRAHEDFLIMWIMTDNRTGYLHLAYFATEISIHRRIVSSLDPATSDPYMLYICRSAAKTRLISAMDFVNRLKPEHLDSFWYFASTTSFALINTFGSLLRATAPGQEEADFYRSRLKEYRWALGVSARRAEWLDAAVRMLDATENLLENLPEKSHSVHASPVQPPAYVISHHHEEHEDTMDEDEEDYDEDDMSEDEYDEEEMA